MKTRVFALLLAALAACAKAPAPAALPAGALKFPAFAVDVAPAFAGKTRLTLAVRTFDENGAPLASAIEGVFIMPAMGSMAEMREQIPKTAEAPSHEAPVDFAMAGKWFLTLRVTAGGGAAELRYAVNTITQDFALERTDPPLAGQGEAAAAGDEPRGVYIPQARRQLIGVTFAAAEARPLVKTVRAFGRVALNEQSVAAVNLQAAGWAREVYVKDVGARVRKGDPLMTLYSPELGAAQEELLIAAGSGDPELLRAAENKLRSLGMPGDQIRAVERRGRPFEEIVVRSPRDGFVLEKGVVEGAAVMMGMTAFRIGNLGRVWVLADVFESDAAFVAAGQRASIRLAHAPQAVPAVVGYVYPTVDEATRTLKVRLEISNPAEALKPGMAADVYIDVPLGRALTVPKTAVLATGEHRYVFVDRGEGYLEPREVRVAPGDGERVRVVAGLAEGERVSTSANFLISSEAQLQNALPKWGAPPTAGEARPVKPAPGGEDEGAHEHAH